MVPNAILPGVAKTTFTIKIDIALKENCSEDRGWFFCLASKTEGRFFCLASQSR